MSCNVELILDVLRAVRSHLSEDVGATEFCGIDECAYHLHLWTQSDDDEGERPPSDCGFSDHTEPILYMSPPNITLDEEDAFAAAHSSEALSEERHIRKESERISGLSLSVLEWNAHVSPYFPWTTVPTDHQTKFGIGKFQYNGMSFLFSLQEQVFF